MNKNFVTLALAATVAAVMMVQPAAAQSGRVYVGGTIATGPDSGQYGAQYDPRYRQQYPIPDRGGRQDYAFSNGYRDGYEKGFDDARDRDRYDLRRHRRYRDGDNGYRREYSMGRNQYRDVYRRGFVSGYDDGYRAAQRGYIRGGQGSYRDRNPRGGFRFEWRF